MHDLGDVVGLAVDLKDAAGTLTNANVVELTITLPDNTTSVPTITNPPATTGKYVYDYTTTQAGRHTVRWVFTTPNAAYTDTFDVRPAANNYILSLADAKEHLNIPTTTTTWDEELRTHLEAVTNFVENRVGPVVRRTVSEVVTYVTGTEYDTRYRRILSVTSIVVLRDGSTPVTLSSIDIDGDQGTLRLKDGTWFPNEPWRLTYVVGRVIVPADITLAAKMILQYTWETQRGISSAAPLVASSPAELLAYGVNIPPRALALLEGPTDRTGFA